MSHAADALSQIQKSAIASHYCPQGGLPDLREQRDYAERDC